MLDLSVEEINLSKISWQFYSRGFVSPFSQTGSVNQGEPSLIQSISAEDFQVMSWGGCWDVITRTPQTDGPLSSFFDIYLVTKQSIRNLELLSTTWRKPNILESHNNSTFVHLGEVDWSNYDIFIGIIDYSRHSTQFHQHVPGFTLCYSILHI